MLVPLAAVIENIEAHLLPQSFNTIESDLFRESCLCLVMLSIPTKRRIHCFE